MTDEQFRILIENSEIFSKYEKFKKGLVLKRTNIHSLKDYYQQAEKYGIAYLKQNPNLKSNDVLLIESCLKLVKNG